MSEASEEEQTFFTALAELIKKHKDEFDSRLPPEILAAHLISTLALFNYTVNPLITS